MKTKIYILTALFLMYFSFLSAGNPKIKETFFTDVEPKPFSEINRLAPITPKEATFEETKSEFNIQPINPFLLEKMAPVTPKEADFEDAAFEKITRIDTLVPTSPMAAAFED